MSFITIVILHARQTVERNKLLKVYHNMHCTIAVNCCALEKGWDIIAQDPYRSPETVELMRCYMYLIVKWHCMVRPTPLNFAVKSGYSITWLQKAISWGRIQVTHAICISFNYSKAALCISNLQKNFFVWTRYWQLKLQVLDGYVYHASVILLCGLQNAL